jgi:hypothetical protein
MKKLKIGEITIPRTGISFPALQTASTEDRLECPLSDDRFCILECAWFNIESVQAVHIEDGAPKTGVIVRYARCKDYIIGELIDE